MKPIRIASRASRLALIQSNYIRDLLVEFCPKADISIVKVSTKGDRNKTEFLHKSGSVGLFSSEVENALLEDKADVAVHSFKDLPTVAGASTFGRRGTNSLVSPYLRLWRTPRERNPGPLHPDLRPERRPPNPMILYSSMAHRQASWRARKRVSRMNSFSQRLA